MPATISLFSRGLLSKWGFGDGDVLDDALWDLADRDGLDVMKGDEQSVLVRAVRRYLLPVLDQDVKVVEISTIHNPIRAETVDGVEVDWYEESNIVLTPDHVDVPLDVLYGWWKETLDQPERGSMSTSEDGRSTTREGRCDDQ